MEAKNEAVRCWALTDARMVTNCIIETVVTALYEAWAQDAGLHESWDEWAKTRTQYVGVS